MGQFGQSAGTAFSNAQCTQLSVLAIASQAELQALLDRVEPFTGSFPHMAQADRGKTLFAADVDEMTIREWRKRLQQAFLR